MQNKFFNFPLQSCLRESNSGNTKLSPWWFNSSVISLKSIENFSNCDPQALFTHNTFKDILVISLLEAYKIEEHTLGVIVRP